MTDQPEPIQLPPVDAQAVLQRVANMSETGAALVRAALAEERLAAALAPETPAAAQPKKRAAKTSRTGGGKPKR